MKPILFNTDMVRAILDGRKTATRRVVKYTENDVYGMAAVRGMWYETYDPKNQPESLIEWYVKNAAKPPYNPGNILYVRETWCELPVKPDGSISGANTFVYYKADGDIRPAGWRDNWKPSIHMPKEATRLFLRVKSVRVERLQDITIAGCKAEGVCEPLQNGDEFDYEFDRDIACWFAFQKIWESTVKPADRNRYGWCSNPWVWVIEFERINKEDV